MYLTHRKTKDLEPLVDEVRLSIDAHDSVIEHYCRRAIVEFCKRSHYWREDIGPVTVMAGVSEYEIIPCRNQKVVQIEKVSALDDLGRRVFFEQGKHQNQNNWSFFHSSPSMISIYPLDDLEGKDLRVEASLMPDEVNSDFEFSEILTDEYFDCLINGAKSYLLMLPRKEWSDPVVGSALMREFRHDADMALVRANNNYARVLGPAQHKPRDFF